MPLQLLLLHPFAADYCQHHHAHHQIVIGIKGHACLVIGHQTAQLSPSVGCLLPAETLHGFQGYGDNQQLVINLPSEAMLQRQANGSHASLFYQPRIFEVDMGLAHLVAFLCHEIEHFPYNLSDTALTMLLDALALRLIPTMPLQRLDMAKIDSFVDTHLDQPLRVAQLAALFHLSAAHFTTLFRQQSGTSPYRYVQARRMQEAKRLIQHTRLPLDHIAARTHFADQSALTHAFRRHFNLTPKAIRAHRAPLTALDR